MYYKISKLFKYSILLLFVFLLYKDYTNEPVNDTVNEPVSDTLIFKNTFKFEKQTIIITEKIY